MKSWNEAIEYWFKAGHTQMHPTSGLNQKFETELKRRDAENVRLKKDLAEPKKLVAEVAVFRGDQSDPRSSQ